ncbi:hypothetical protein [Dyella sp.]|jgi:drug/metabolite transporter (DMT)-like permease|uniref:hypothetical protein n=1 Tax=Dyella sp. TaxID=1869338 RepID=UPI002FDB16E3
MIRINSRFVRQTIDAFALIVGVSTVSFAQDANSTSTDSTSQTTGASQSLGDILSLTCSACTGGSSIHAK